MIKLKNICQSLNHSNGKGLLDINLSIEQGAKYCVSDGTSHDVYSLIQMIIGLEPPKSGEVLINNQSIYGLNDQKQAMIRRSLFGLIGQSVQLFSALNIFENMQLACKIKGVEKPTESIMIWLNRLGVSHLLDKKPNQLSEVEQQLVLIARAFVIKPSIVIGYFSTRLNKKESQVIKNRIVSLTEISSVTLLLFTKNMIIGETCPKKVSLNHKRKIKSS